MRMEPVEKHGIWILNDTYNANPVSTKAALDVLMSFGGEKASRRIAVLGDMLELGDEGPKAHEQVGRQVATHSVDYLFTVGELSHYTIQGALRTGMEESLTRHFEDNGTLSSYLADFLHSGDVVLLKGSRGMRMEEMLESIG